MDHGLKVLKRKLTTNPLCELLGSATCQRHQGFGEVDQCHLLDICLPAFNLHAAKDKHSSVDVSTLPPINPPAMCDLMCHLTDTPLLAGKRLKEPLENPTPLSFPKAVFMLPLANLPVLYYLSLWSCHIQKIMFEVCMD